MLFSAAAAALSAAPMSTAAAAAAAALPVRAAVHVLVDIHVHELLSCTEAGTCTRKV